MNARKVRSLVVFLVSLCGLVAGNSQANCRLTEFLSGNGIAWNFREGKGHRAEQVWIHCRKELKDSSSDAVELFDWYLPQAITDLPPQVKKILLDCLRKKNFWFHASGKEVVTKTQFIKCLQLLCSSTNVPRRYLQSKARPHKAPSPRKAPAPRKAPLPLPPQYDRKTPESPAKNRNPSVRAPPVAVGHPPPVKKNAIRKYTIAAIAAASVATFAVVALLLFCCLKGNNNKTGPLDGQRDGKRLLNVSSSYKPAGLVQKSQAVENSSKKVSTTPPSMNNPNDVADSHGSSLAGTQSVKDATGASGNSQAPLPLAPGETAPPPPRPPPPPPPKPPAPNPPPPPKIVRPPPMPPKSGNMTKPSPPGARYGGHSSSGEGNDLTESDVPKTKLKPFFWDKVLANPDHSMVWHDIKAGSFQFNEEMMENLFGYTPAEKNKNERNKKLSSFDASTPSIQLIDAKKSQNLAILLRSLHVKTEEVCDALKEGNELPAELVEILLRMAPTTDEELKIRLFCGELSELGPAEQFLKVMVDIPFAFKRLESLLFMGSLQEQVSSILESFATLEVACKELRNSRLFLKLLEAVLKTGNRMNDGTLRGGAQAFKLDTLLKLSDVKGTDGKTTLLHFVVQEIIRSEGIRAARTIKQSQSMSSMKTEDLVEDSTHETAEYYRNLGLKVVSGLGNDLENVRKAALVDGDALTAIVSKLGQSLSKTREFLNTEMKGVEEKGNFCNALAGFVQNAEVDIKRLQEEEKRIMVLVKSTADYFHGDAGKDEGLRLFVVVREFLVMLDKTCTEVRSSTTMPPGTSRKEALTASPSQESRQSSMADVRERLFPAIKGMRMHDSGSDDETYSP